uniref:Retinoic acid receptor responder protein 2 n=1 Tax=Suricata suricatta TaxID=37032 RepID=A0A673USK6_SURSU
SHWPYGWAWWAWAERSSQRPSSGACRWPWKNSTSTHPFSGPSRRLAWTAPRTRLAAPPGEGEPGGGHKHIPRKQVQKCLGSGAPSHLGRQRAVLPGGGGGGGQVTSRHCSAHSGGCWPFSVCRQPFPAGTFVRLEFKLQQTNCRKKDWKKAECKVKPNGRKRKCLACVKLNSADKVLGRMVHCPIFTQVQRPEDQHEAQCGRVERAGEDPHSHYFPGQFAFFKALPSS